MQHVTGFDRQQAVLFPVAIEAMIAEDHVVRVIDVFVDGLDFEKLGFDHVRLKGEGRPPYHPSDLLKLFIYGYLNRYRSVRMLEAECKRNIELMWLLRGLQPDHNTINNFRKSNPKAIKKVFRQTVTIAKNMDLIGGLLIAGDSTKLRAQNAKKNNFNEKKIKQHLEYIERKLEEHNRALAEADGDQQQDQDQQEHHRQEINKHQKRKKQYHRLEKDLKESGQPQISRSDPDSRQLMIRNNITEVAYNIQSTVDAKHKLLLDYQVTNQNDKLAMAPMVARAKAITGKQHFTALFDKGYHTGHQIARCHQLGVETLVAFPAPSKPKNLQRIREYETERF
jgi:transposase